MTSYTQIVVVIRSFVKQGEEMGASCFVVLWHKIMLSPAVWFLVEVFAKKPWKWSLYSSLALTGFFPLLALLVFTLGSVIFGLFALVIVHCGFLALALGSLISSAIMISPVALLLTFFIYMLYKVSVLTVRAVRWLLALPSELLKQARASVSGLARTLRFWKNGKRKPPKDASSGVRSRTEQRIRRRNLQQKTERQTRKLEETQRQQRRLEDSDTEEGYGNHRQAFHPRKKSTGWFDWLNQSDSDSSISASDQNVGACRHGYEFQRSGSQRNSALRCRVCLERGSASSLSSDGETVKFTSGSGSDSFDTADEWLAEDFSGNVIPDYRDRESKLYDALLKRDFCQGADTYMYY